MSREKPDPAPIAALQRYTHPSGFATALSFSRRRDRPDFGPELMQWHFAHDDRHTELVTRFVLAVIALFAGMNQINATTRGFVCAAYDAMVVVRSRRRKHVTSTKERAAEVHMREGSFRTLRNVGESHLLNAIRRATERYLRVCGHNIDHAGIYAFAIAEFQSMTKLTQSPVELLDEIGRIDGRLAELGADVMDRRTAAKFEGMVRNVMAKLDESHAPADSSDDA